MLKRIFLLAATIFALSVTTTAQGITDKVEIFGGYSFMRADTSPSFNTNGWELSGQYKLRSWLGGVVDIDGHYGTFEGVHSHLNDYLFGPQVSFPAPVTPFAHVLVGEGHFNANGVSDNSIAYGFGFGLDKSIVPQIAWRIIQFDVIHTHLFNQSENNDRLSTGIVIHF